MMMMMMKMMMMMMMMMIVDLYSSLRRAPLLRYVSQCLNGAKSPILNRDSLVPPHRNT